MGRKNRNARSRNAGMKGRAKRFAGEFLPKEILRDLREDFASADKYSADDDWDDDLNIEVIEVRLRGVDTMKEDPWNDQDFTESVPETCRYKDSMLAVLNDRNMIKSETVKLSN